mgnify:CR=1 FL=1
MRNKGTTKEIEYAVTHEVYYASWEAGRNLLVTYEVGDLWDIMDMDFSTWITSYYEYLVPNVWPPPAIPDHPNLGGYLKSIK